MVADAIADDSIEDEDSDNDKAIKADALSNKKPTGWGNTDRSIQCYLCGLSTTSHQDKHHIQ